MFREALITNFQFTKISISIISARKVIPGGVVHHGVLEKGPEHEEDTDAGPDVYGLGVGDWGQGVLDAGLGGGHRQEGRHSQRHPGRHRLVVQPEGHPGDRHRHGARHVDGDDEEGELSGEEKFDSQTGVRS